MKSRILVNIILLLTLILIIGFIAFKPEQKTSSTTLTTLDKNSIQQIIIHKENSQVIVKKLNNQWHMSSPHNLPAHEFRIHSLLSLLSARSANHYDIDSIDLKTYGLLQPRAHIQFDNTHIYFGKANPVNAMRYIRVNDEMHLVFDELYPLIRSQPSSFVDLSLLPADSEITKLSLPDLKLVKSETGWTSSTEKSTRPDQIQLLLQNWSYAKAFAVHAYVKRKFLGEIEIELASSSTIKFNISDISPWLILARTDLNIEYHLDESQSDVLFLLQKEPNQNEK